MHNLSNKILKNNVVLVCIILLLGFAAHICVLGAPFKALDDNVSIVNNSDIKDFANIGKIFTSSFFGGKHYYRPMVALGFMIEHHFFGLRPFHYNLTNLGLHLAIAVSVFFLIFLIFNDRGIAFFTSLLFAVHPIHWEAVANIPGRAVILSTFFAVNAFLFYCLAKGRGKAVVASADTPPLKAGIASPGMKPFLYTPHFNAGSLKGFIYYILSLVFFTCGLLSKESAVMLPILLAAYMLLVEKNLKKWPGLLPFFLIIFAYLFARRELGIMETFPWCSANEYFLGFLTFLRATVTYLRLFIWPAGLHFDRAQEMFLKLSDTGLLETVLAFLGAGVALVKWRKNISNYAWFFAAWFCIELFPVSQIITTIGVGPGYISTAEHFLYMPSIGMFVLLVLAGRALYRLNQKTQFFSANLFRLIVVSIFLSLMLVTVHQEIFARSALSMFQRTLLHNPDNARILYSTGLEMVNRKRFGAAADYFQRALAREPTHVSYRLALGRALFDQGRVMEGIAVYETISDAGQWNRLLEINRDEAYQKAIAQHQKVITDEPGNAQARYRLGSLYSRHKRIDEAVEQYKQALAIDPAHKQALFNLGSSYEALGWQDRAVEYYLRVIALDGTKGHLDYYIYEYLAEIYQRQGDAAKAELYLQMSTEMRERMETGGIK